MTSRRLPSPTVRLATTLVLAALVPPALGACTSGGDISPVLSGGARGDRPGEAPPMPQDVAAAFDHAIEATRSVQSADVLMTASVATDVAGAEGEIAADGTSHVRGFDGGGGEVELRSDGETAWVRVGHPELVAELPDGVRWIRGRYDELVEDGVVYALGEAWNVLPVLRGVESAEDLGVEQVEGVPVRMLRAELDLGAAHDAASDEERAGLEDAISVGGDGEVRRLVARVGLDGDGRVRSLELDIELDGAASLSPRLSLEVRAFNQAVEAPAPPPAHETVDADEVPELVELLQA